MVVVDVEIKLPVTKKEDWKAAREGKLGLSIACVYDTTDDRMYFYDEHTLSDLIHHLETADLVVSYNGQAFDLPLLEGMVGRPLDIRRHCDVLQEIWCALNGRYKGYKLDEVAIRTLGYGKTGSGDHAPTLFAAGRIAELVQYCSDDVYLTYVLYEHIRANGAIVDMDGNLLPMEL
jgi:DEAD/DEAH box helicase domain-containing protein